MAPGCWMVSLVDGEVDEKGSWPPPSQAMRNPRAAAYSIAVRIEIAMDICRCWGSSLEQED